MEQRIKKALFYGRETWLTNDLKSAEAIYNATLKNLLGVRATTCNDITFAECGELGAKAYIRNQQKTFLSKLTDRSHYQGSYLEKIITLAQQSLCPAGLILKDLLNSQTDLLTHSEISIRNSIMDSVSTRRSAYRNLNPRLEVSSVYTMNIPEFDRIAFTRMRLSSHHLQYEKGRWSRIPPDERLCPCGMQQTDKHVLLDCHITQANRIMYSIPDCSMSELYDLPGDRVAAYCRAVLRKDIFY